LPAPRNWGNIKVGSLVLVRESLDDGWWEAFVTSIDAPNITVRWRDYQRGVTRRRDQIALFYSAT